MSKKSKQQDKPALLRCFLGLAYPLASALSPLVDRLGQMATDTGLGLRLMDPDKLHITLKFLGNLNETQLHAVDEVAGKVCATHEAVTLNSVGMGMFRNALWAGIEGTPALTSLAGALEQAVLPQGIAAESRDYMPHVTVARFNPGARSQLQDLQDAFATQHWGQFQAGQAHLYLSETLPEGARYTILESYELGSATD